MGNNGSKPSDVEPIDISNPQAKGLELDEKKVKKHYTISPDGTIKFTFSHFNQKYEAVSKAIENFKNLLKLESPMELTALLFKLDKIKQCVVGEEYAKELEGIISTTKIITKIPNKHKASFNRLRLELNNKYVGLSKKFKGEK